MQLAEISAQLGVGHGDEWRRAVAHHLEQRRRRRRSVRVDLVERVPRLVRLGRRRHQVDRRREQLRGRARAQLLVGAHDGAQIGVEQQRAARPIEPRVRLEVREPPLAEHEAVGRIETQLAAVQAGAHLLEQAIALGQRARRGGQARAEAGLQDGPLPRQRGPIVTAPYAASGVLQWRLHGTA